MDYIRERKKEGNETGVLIIDWSGYLFFFFFSVAISMLGQKESDMIFPGWDRIRAQII